MSARLRRKGRSLRSLIPLPQASSARRFTTSLMQASWRNGTPFTDSSERDRKKNRILLGAPRIGIREPRRPYLRRTSEGYQAMSQNSGAVTRTVLVAQTNLPPVAFEVNALPEDAREAHLAHAKFDSASAQQTLIWIQSIEDHSKLKSIISTRLSMDPKEIISLRLEQDIATSAEWPDVEKRHVALAAANPGNPDLIYLAIRSHRDDEDTQDMAFIEAYQKYPQHPWLANAAGVQSRSTRPIQSRRTQAYMCALTFEPIKDAAAIECARVRRISGIGNIEGPFRSFTSTGNHTEIGKHRSGTNRLKGSPRDQSATSGRK